MALLAILGSNLNGLRRLIYISSCFCLLFPSISWAQQEQKQPKEDKESRESAFPLDNFYAKIKKQPRSIFKNISFGFSTGYGNTFFSHNLDGYGVYQAKSHAPAIFAAGAAPLIRYSNWVNTVTVDTAKLKPGSYVISSDSAKLGFKGNAINIPFKATIHYSWGGKYRIGAGYSYEYMSIGSFHPTSYSDKISSFQPSAASGWMSKFFGMAGVSFYRMGYYLFTGDLQVGKYNPGSNFNSSLIQKGLYVNLGVTIERELSEYLRIFVRPSFDFKSYSLNNFNYSNFVTMVPENGNPIVHNINAFYLNFGISYSLPELRKCIKHDCKIQMNHAHGDQEYRSRVHPIYKKQNPLYGENHPNLIKYKGKNKRKLSPY